MTDDAGPVSETPSAITEEDLNKIPPEIRVKVERSFEMIRSPLLPPAVLAQYDQTIPGLAQKLVDWTETESLHRRELEKAAFEETKILRARSQVSGVVIAALGLLTAGLVGVFASQNGSAAGATAACVIAIVSVGGPFAARLLASAWGGDRGSHPE